jgi:hypothetical protein
MTILYYNLFGWSMESPIKRFKGFAMSYKYPFCVAWGSAEIRDIENPQLLWHTHDGDGPCGLWIVKESLLSEWERMKIYDREDEEICEDYYTQYIYLTQIRDKLGLPLGILECVDTYIV